MRELVKKLIPQKVFISIEPYGHLLEAVLANLAYGFPARKLKVIGVTGTDGKTTTSTMIHAMLKNAGFKVGLMTTVSVDYGKGAKPNPTRLTTMTSFAVFRTLRAMRAAGLEWVVLETTSHALAQNRVWGIPYKIAVKTNVTHEHLDYHRTFERYRAAKLKLFKIVGKQPGGVGIVNADDPSGLLFASAVRRAISYGIKEGELKALDIQSSPSGSQFKALYEDRTMDVRVNLPGSFNVLNALATAAVGVALGLADQQIETGIDSLKSVEGRMDDINEGQDFTVIVDYAHTPDSFKKVFVEIRPITEGRLIVAFGSAGRRDKAKRMIQGQVAGQYCDVVIATEEDDRDEDGVAILNEIASGAEIEGKVRDKDLFLIHDRAKAIKFAAGMAEAGDVILLLGKGHEKSILGNDGKRSWDEAGVARKAIRARLEAEARSKNNE